MKKLASRYENATLENLFIISEAVGVHYKKIISLNQKYRNQFG
jgi:hypothetical protein